MSNQITLIDQINEETNYYELNEAINKGLFIEKYGSIKEEREVLRELKKHIKVNEDAKRLFATILYMSPPSIFVDGEFKIVDAYKILLNYQCNSKKGYTKYIYQYLTLMKNWMSYCKDFNDIDTNLEWIGGTKERNYCYELVNAIYEGVEFPRGILPLIKRMCEYYNNMDEYVTIVRNATLNGYKEAIVEFARFDSTPLEQKELLIEKCIKENYGPAYRVLATLSNGKDTITYLKKAFELGDINALVPLADLYHFGMHVKKDNKIAKELLELAAYKYNIPRAFINLGILSDDDDKTNEYYYKAFLCNAEKHFFPENIQVNYKYTKYYVINKAKLNMYGKPSVESKMHTEENTSWLLDYFPKDDLIYEDGSYSFYCNALMKIKSCVDKIDISTLDNYLEYELDYYNNLVTFYDRGVKIGEFNIGTKENLDFIYKYLDNKNYKTLIRATTHINPKGELNIYIGLYNNKETKVNNSFNYNEIAIVLT